MRTWWSYLSVGMGYVIVAEDDGEQVAAEIRDEPTARLLAAAPALLRSLEELILDIRNMDYDIGPIKGDIARAEAEIRKAKGEVGG